MGTLDHAERRQFGDVIREQRKLLGVSQERFAEICEVHRTYIGQVERGEKNLSFDSILRIAKGLEKPPSTLFELANL